MKGDRSKKNERIKNYEWQSEIFQKALNLFLEKGYNATPMSRIAEVLDVSKPNLYYYCSSKENLLYQINMDFMQKYFIPILEEAEQLSDPQQRLELFLRKFTLLNTSYPAARVLIYEIHNLSKSHYREITTVWRRAYGLVRGAIKELQQSGKARKFRGSFLTFIGTGIVNWIVFWFDYSRQNNAGELAEAVVQTFLHGLLYSVNGEG